MSLTIGAFATTMPVPPAIRPSPAASAGGGGIVALGLAARAASVSSPLLDTLQQTDTALASAVASLGTDITV